MATVVAEVVVFAVEDLAFVDTVLLVSPSLSLASTIADSAADQSDSVAVAAVVVLAATVAVVAAIVDDAVVVTVRVAVDDERIPIPREKQHLHA